MPIRKQELVNEEYYHVYSRSIAKYIVFNDAVEFGRVLKLIRLYRFDNFTYKYSQFMDLEADTQTSVICNLEKENDLLVEIVAYCLMPTHIHLFLKQLKDKGIEKYLSKILNAYSRYFNEKHHRNGPLWTGRFKNVLVDNDEQLLHLTRYIHLNPVSVKLVNKPELWCYSSYLEYINQDRNDHLCNIKTIIDMDSKQYKKFVDDRKDYQKTLSLIKHISIDDYTG